MAGLSQPSNDAFVEQHWGASWSELFPQKPAAANVYLGPQTDAQRADMRRLMVLVIRELHVPWLLRRRLFRLYDAAVA